MCCVLPGSAKYRSWYCFTLASSAMVVTGSKKLSCPNRRSVFAPASHRSSYGCLKPSARLLMQHATLQRPLLCEGELFLLSSSRNWLMKDGKRRAKCQWPVPPAEERHKGHSHVSLDAGVGLRPERYFPSNRATTIILPLYRPLTNLFFR